MKYTINFTEEQEALLTWAMVEMKCKDKQQVMSKAFALLMLALDGEGEVYVMKDGEKQEIKIK